MAWVSVDDRMPPGINGEVSPRVLIALVSKEYESAPVYQIVTIGYYHHSLDEWRAGCKPLKDYKRVTHWMALPEPPEVDDVQ